MSKTEWITLSVIVVIGALLVIHALGPGAVTPKSVFTVVDSYKGCDVVRYDPPTEARYHYFLDCNHTKEVK